MVISSDRHRQGERAGSGSAPPAVWVGFVGWIHGILTHRTGDFLQETAKKCSLYIDRLFIAGSIIVHVTTTEDASPSPCRRGVQRRSTTRNVTRGEVGTPEIGDGCGVSKYGRHCVAKGRAWLDIEMVKRASAPSKDNCSINIGEKCFSSDSISFFRCV